MRASQSERASDDAAHDEYFLIRRVDGNRSGIFVRAVLRARLVLMDEVDDATFAVPPGPWQIIDRALADLLSGLLGAGAKLGAPITHFDRNGTSPRLALRRWVRGHHLFAILTQGLIFSLKTMARVIRADEPDEVSRWADTSASLMRGCAAAFRFTGDFAPEEYEDSIRPSMMPPASPVNLSGLMSADHRVLVQTIRDMRPALKALREQDAARHNMLCAELTDVYDQHIYVCERFVGQRPSIRTAASTELAGPALLEQFKSLRLKPFEHERRVARVASGVPARCPVRHES